MERKELQDKLLECEKLQQQLWAYRPLSAETLKSLREYYRIDLTYTSNAIEGNSLTESETKVVIEDGLTLEGKPLLPEQTVFSSRCGLTIARNPDGRHIRLFL